jgi:hypothetical protein
MGGCPFDQKLRYPASVAFHLSKALIDTTLTLTSRGAQGFLYAMVFLDKCLDVFGITKVLSNLL